MKKCQAFRIPTIRETREPYRLAGNVHWSEWTDVPIRQFNTIWTLPLAELGAEIQTEDGVEIPLVRNQMTDEYWIVKFDADYLKERFYREWVEALHWTPQIVKSFFTINEQWINERIYYFQKSELMDQAEQLASKDPQGRSIEFWYNQLVIIQKEEEAPEIDKPPRISGMLEKLGNEWFIVTPEKHRYKVLASQLTSQTLPNGIISDLIGCDFSFTVDSTKQPPKSRNAKGWVSTLELNE